MDHKEYQVGARAGHDIVDKHTLDSNITRAILFGGEIVCPDVIGSIINGSTLNINDIMSVENVGTQDEPSIRFRLKVSSSGDKIVSNFQSLRDEVTYLLYSLQTRAEAMNTALFNLHRAFEVIELYGEAIEDFIYFEVTEDNEYSPIRATDAEFWRLLGVNKPFVNLSIAPGRLDVCECPNLLKCPNGTATGTGSPSSFDACVPRGNDIIRRISAVSVNQSDTFSSENRQLNSVILKAAERARFTFDFSGLMNNITYGIDHRISIYVNCKPCPIQYRCDQNLEVPQCTAPDINEQYKNMNDCLRSYRIPICVNSQASSVNLSYCMGNATVLGKSHLLYTVPDSNHCMSLPFFCSDQNITVNPFRRLCQDSSPQDIGSVYDCTLVAVWALYVQWRNKICCSGSQLLSGLNPCLKGQCNPNNPLIERVIRENVTKEFQTIYGVVPPNVEPRGEFLMDIDQQEDRNNPQPLSLFNSALWNIGSNQIINQSGCCRCQPHSMPLSIQSSTERSGFPDDKHTDVYLSVTSLADVNLTVAVELLNGRYINEFDTYFVNDVSDRIIKSSFSHSTRFSGLGPFEWICVLEKNTIIDQDLDLPYNLPLVNISSGQLSLENLILVDRPSAMLSRKTNRIKSTSIEQPTRYDDDGRHYSSNLAISPLRDGLLLSVRGSASWWDSGDKTIVNGIGHRAFQFLGLPYLPFISNCDAFDSHISLSALLEDHPQCELVPANGTRPVKQNPFYRQFSPIGDHCIGDDNRGAGLHCTFEESVDQISEKNRWYESGAGVTLFFISRDPLLTDDFTAKYDNSTLVEPWGRSRIIADMVNTSLLIPITVDPLHAGKRNAIPRSITLELKYYQRTQFDKRLVEGNLYFDELCTTLKPVRHGGNAALLNVMSSQGVEPCALDIQGHVKSLEYSFRVLIYPLDWFALFNKFEFDMSVYISIYSLIGLLSLSICACLWLLCRATTKLRYPPPFKGLNPAFKILQSTTMGCLLAVTPIYICLYLTLSYLNSWSLYAPFRWLTAVGNFVNLFPAAWYSTTMISSDIYTSGRIGVSLLFMGFYISVTGATAVTFDHYTFHRSWSKEGNQQHKEAKEPESIWIRAHFFLFLIISEFALLGVWEFSYSSYFQSHTLQFIFLLKLAELVLELFFDQVFKSPLQYIPVNVALRTTEVLITMGARDFVNFIVLIFAQKSCAVVIKIYVHPYVKICCRLWPRWEFLITERLQLIRTMSYERKKENDQHLQCLNSDIEQKSDGVDPILEALEDISIDWVSGVMAPLMLILLKVLYTETQIASNYDIRVNEVFYYALFALYMIPWSIAIDVVTLNSLALFRGWRVFEYLSYQSYRFQSRKHRWALHSRSYDHSISSKLWSLDLLGFSSQFYFLVTYCSSGIILTMISITILLRTQGYNILSDPATSLLCCIVIVVCRLVHLTCMKLSRIKIDYLSWRGLWAVHENNGVIDDFIASKFALGKEAAKIMRESNNTLNISMRQSFVTRFWKITNHGLYNT